MTEKKTPQSSGLNIRVDEALSREIDRIAKVEGTSASEAARKPIAVEVQRQVEASYPDSGHARPKGMPRRIVITAECK
jgi:predicted transcriptional regulator